MTSPFHPVARGLRLARTGFRLAVLLAALCFCMLMAVVVFNLTDFLRTNRPVGHIYGVTVYLLFFAAFGGSLVGFVGRCFCLATPPELPVARTRIRLAVLLEGCGWLSGVAYLGIAFLLAARLLPLPKNADGVTAGFSLLLLIAGRVTFLWYARSLADGVSAPHLARRAARSLTLFVAVAACGVVGFALSKYGYGNVAFGVNTTPHDAATALVCGLLFAAALVGLYGLWVYDRLLAGLRRAVAAFGVGEEPAG